MIPTPQDGNPPDAGVATHDARLPMRISPLREMQPTSAHRTVIPYCQHLIATEDRDMTSSMGGGGTTGREFEFLRMSFSGFFDLSRSHSLPKLQLYPHPW